MTGGRSGSSMVCGLLAGHGVWSGTTKDGDWRNPDGFFENHKIYKEAAKYGTFKKETGIATHDGEWPKKFWKIVKGQGYESGPLLIKHIPNCWPIWDDLDPIYVTTRRPVEAQMASRKNIKKVLGKAAIEGREEQLDWLEQNRDAIRVDYDDVVNGKYGAIVEVLKRCDIEPNKAFIKSFVNPQYRRF